MLRAVRSLPGRHEAESANVTTLSTVVELAVAATTTDLSGVTAETAVVLASQEGKVLLADAAGTVSALDMRTDTDSVRSVGELSVCLDPCSGETRSGPTQLTRSGSPWHRVAARSRPPS